MNFFLKLLIEILKLLNSLIPKSSKKIIFISRPDFSDNTFHMYCFMKEKTNNKQLSWLIYDKKIFNLLIFKGHKNVFYIKSIQGIWQYCRSKFIITSSSSLWQVKSPFQKQFDLWHGIPLKNILCMGEDSIQPKKQAPSITMRFATSSISKALLSASFDYNAMNIAITGQPRTDALFESKDYLSDLLEINIKKFDKVVIYMPTYRIGYGNQKDGRTFDSTNIFRLKSYVHKDFLNYLERNNILFLLKLHPYEETLYKEVALGKNIKWITNDILVEKELSIYNLLSNTDILITDYSSIYFDFLLLDKKIIFLPVDLDYYKKNRGFELEPYEFWTPGEKVFCIDDLEKAILIDDSELEKKQRKNICDIMFRNQDANSSERVFNQIRESYKDFA